VKRTIAALAALAALAFAYALGYCNAEDYRD
jgi:hypothetical protein